jgi:hypothetical protein
MRNGPLEIALLLLIALTGCRGEGEPGGNEAAHAGSAPGAPVQTDTLTGLYESGDGPRRNQMCMIEREEGSTTFGFVTWSSGDTNCSGSGVATRDGKRLRLVLDGDESCTLEARVDGRRVTFPGTIPAECNRYYCGTGARMTGVSFDKVGGGEADAMRAADLVGDRLCGG